MLTRFVRIQLAIFSVASVIGVLVLAFAYIQVPTLLGLGRITVTLELPGTGGSIDSRTSHIGAHRSVR